MKQYELQKGMILYCKNGETVTVEAFTDTHIWVEYKSRIHERPIAIINEKLFFEDPSQRVSSVWKHDVVARYNYSDSRERPRQAFDNEEKDTASCMNCRFQISGECSSWTPCEEFQPVYKVSPAEMSYWPKEGDATRFKRKRNRK